MLSVSLDFESFRTVESNLYNKTSELQEEICLKKLDLRVAQLHLAAVKAQVWYYPSFRKTKNKTDGKEEKKCNYYFSSY